MKICVLGAGVIGVTTAYALGRLGHDVTVIEQAEQIASGASHANGAQLSYSHIDPFASPQTLSKLPGYLLGRDPGVKLGMSLSPSYLSWGLKFIRNCTPRRSQENLQARSKLATLSREALEVFEQELPASALKRTGEGKLVIAHTEKNLTELEKSERPKLALGIETQILNRSECIDKEPALAHWATQLVGGSYNPDDTSLDPLIYCQALKEASERKFGVQFAFNQTIQSIERINGSSFIVVTNDKEFDCDQVVVCLGAGVNKLHKSTNTRVPLLSMQGYSLTLPAKEPKLRTSVTDPKNKIVFANIGDRVRIAGFMDANQNPSKSRKRGVELLERAKNLWPGIADFNADPHIWTNYRPMTPSGVPIVGLSKQDGIYLNGGHGSLGYTFAAGSAMKIAEMIGHQYSNG